MKTKGIRHRLGRWAALLAVGMAAVGLVAPPCVATYAQDTTLTRPGADDYYTYVHDGMEYRLGPIGYDAQQRRYYCIDQSKLSNYVVGAATELPDTKENRQVAVLLQAYQHVTDDQYTQQALAVIVHDAYDTSTGTDGWQANRALLYRIQPRIFTRAEELKARARALTPAGIAVEAAYGEGRRDGTVHVHVRNEDGQDIAGVPFALELSGDAAFADGGSHYQGTTGADGARVAWRATGDGTMAVGGTATMPSMELVTSSQNLVRLGPGILTSLDEVDIPVRLTFAPAIRTSTAPKSLEPGASVTDIVTLELPGEDNVWPDGAQVRADGWYFDGIGADELDRPLAAPDGQDATQFLETIAARGHRPAAHASVTFEAAGQAREVRALDGADGTADFAARGGFGTWVWAVRRDAQDDRVRELLAHDSVSGFLETAETNVTRARVAVESTVGEHTAHVGSSLTDTITVDGFPKDHGDFAGDGTLGIGADLPYAQVRVWWTGDGDGGDDNAWRPDGTDEPAEDEHHRLVGTWDYPAANGRIRVGGGEPDAHGEPVRLEADRPGWYVFVWSFAGDDRVLPAASAWDDGWERTRVHGDGEPVPDVTITTQVQPGHVLVDEDFHDTALVEGTVPEGATVTFEAYAAVGEDEDPDANGTLMVDTGIALDPTQRSQVVHSQATRSPRAGLVHWRAAVVGEDGDILASHLLGVDGETVTVAEPPASEPETPLAVTGSSILAAGLTALAAAVAGTVPLVRRRRHGGPPATA